MKTDVYSFGVVVLEVGTGRKPVEDDGTVVVDYVWNLWEKRKLIEAADPRLMGKFDALEMERRLMVGLLCFVCTQTMRRGQELKNTPSINLPIQEPSLLCLLGSKG